MRVKSIIVCLLMGFLLTSFTVYAGNDVRFYVYNAANGLADNSAQTIECTWTGRLVITTMGQINFFDGQHFTFIDPSSENLYPLPDYTGNYHLFFDRYHHLWLKNTHNVTCVNLTTERFADSIEDEFEKLGVTGKVKDMFVDQNNEVWLKTKEGLYYSELKRYYDIPKGELQDLEVWQKDYLLLFFSDGLMTVTDLKTGEKIHSGYAYDKAKSRQYNRSSVLRPVGNTIFQIRNGVNEGILMRLDVGTWEWKTILETPYYLSNITEKDSMLYIPCSYGYWTYDLKTEEKVHTEKLQMESGEMLLTDINAMVFDKQGGLWAGTEKRGLLYSRPNSSPFMVYPWTEPRALELSDIMDKVVKPVYTFRKKNVNCVYRDSRGWTWVGTSSGLQLYRKASDKLPQVITRYDGLLNNVIHTIIEDNSSHIWVGTSYGISCLVIDDGKIRYINSYNQWDRIPSESFVNGRAVRLDDGTIVMQMLDHVIEFNPSKMTTIKNHTSYEIYPKLIRLMVNGNNIRTGEELGGRVILEKALSRTKEINLNYDQNSVSLTFSGLNYFRPQQTYYRVRVNGLDNTWKVLTRANSGGLVDAQGQLHLPLVALKPGTYSIEVQTSMLPDQWDTVPYEWIVNIHEPWWRTTGVMVLFTSFLILLLCLNAYYYLKNSKMRTMRDSEERSIIKRIKMFADRCSRQGGELLEPIPEEISGISSHSSNELSPEFMAIMTKMLPLVQSKEASEMSMRELSNAAGMEVQKFYQLVMANIYKSPRPLIRKLMMSKALEMLETTDKDILEIAYECGYVTPNFFIASFYRQMRMTPEEYLAMRRRKRSTVG